MESQYLRLIYNSEDTVCYRYHKIVSVSRFSYWIKAYHIATLTKSPNNPDEFIVISQRPFQLLKQHHLSFKKETGKQSWMSYIYYKQGQGGNYEYMPLEPNMIDEKHAEILQIIEDNSVC